MGIRQLIVSSCLRVASGATLRELAPAATAVLPGALWAHAAEFPLVDTVAVLCGAEPAAIAFVGVDGHADLKSLTAKSFAMRLLGKAPRVRFVLLSGSNSAALGSALVQFRARSNLTCVIGWKTCVDAEAARQFGEHLFAELWPDPRAPDAALPDDASGFQTAFNNAVVALENDGWDIGNRGHRIAGMPVCITPGAKPHDKPHEHLPY
ncbi:hypothetical protein T492DRAFT_955807 [Pavlovales sp. CCMP2436]|nr:hypothetical protein T492DRAFT_955807 [Pavlovales sp. CCMP2436]